MREESAENRRRSIDKKKVRLRWFEKQLKRDRGWFHWLRKPRDPSGDELYRRLIDEWREAMEDGAELALRVGVRGIGRFLYPESYATAAPPLWRIIDEGMRRDAEVLIEAILLAEEAEFRSPLPYEEHLAAMAIKNCMEMMLILELGVAPPTLYTQIDRWRREKRAGWWRSGGAG